MPMLRRLLLSLVLLVAGAVGLPGAAQAKGKPVHAGRTTILVSLDGFRADYFDRGLTPTLKALADHGVRAKAMHPSFPSLTFPRHYLVLAGFGGSDPVPLHRRLEALSEEQAHRGAGLYGAGLPGPAQGQAA